MIKCMLLPTLLLAAVITHAQDLTRNHDTILQHVLDSACNCISHVNPKTALTDKNNALGNCFLNGLKANRIFLSARAAELYGDSAEAKFDQFTHATFIDAFFNAPWYCDAFITLIDSARFYYDYRGNRDSLKAVLANYLKMDRKLSGNYFYHRGNVYMLMGNYKKAMADADSAVIDKPKDERNWQLKEWALELNNRFDEALVACNTLLHLQADNPGYQLLPVILKRKKQLSEGK